MIDGDIRTFYREKRIQRILSLYHRLQSAPRLTGKQAPMVSRDSIIQVLVTFVCLLICGAPFGFVAKSLNAPVAGFVFGLVAAFSAVEIADWILQKSRRALDLTFDFILPLLVVVLTVVAVVGVKYFNWATLVPVRFEEWRAGVNQRLQQRPLMVKLRQTASADWAFATNEQGQLIPLTWREAQAFCADRGPGWEVYSGTAHADVFADRAFYIWWAPGSRAAQVEPMGLTPPRAFVSAQETDRHATLCVRSGKAP